MRFPGLDRPPFGLQDGHKDVVSISIPVSDGIPAHPLFPEARGQIGPAGTGVEGEHVQGQPVEAQRLEGKVPSDPDRPSAQALSPVLRAEDADAEVGTAGIPVNLVDDAFPCNAPGSSRQARKKEITSSLE